MSLTTHCASISMPSGVSITDLVPSAVYLIDLINFTTDSKAMTWRRNARHTLNHRYRRHVLRISFYNICSLEVRWYVKFQLPRRSLLNVILKVLSVQCYAWTEYKFTCVRVCVSVTLSVNSPTDQTPQRIFTVDSLKDADLRKDVPFGGLDDE